VEFRFFRGGEPRFWFFLMMLMFLLPHSTEGTAMISFINWFIPAFIGVQFTLLGCLKLYGLSRGVVGGADKPFMIRLCGT
jgi:hypothetical protein